MSEERTGSGGTGEGVRVFITDTGGDASHPEFEGRMTADKDGPVNCFSSRVFPTASQAILFLVSVLSMVRLQLMMVVDMEHIVLALWVQERMALRRK